MLEIKKKSIQLCCVRGMSEFGCRGFIHSMKKKGRRGGEVKKVDNEIIVSPPKRTTESDPHRGKIGGVKKEKPMLRTMTTILPVRTTVTAATAVVYNSRETRVPTPYWWEER